MRVIIQSLALSFCLFLVLLCTDPASLKAAGCKTGGELKGQEGCELLVDVFKMANERPNFMTIRLIYQKTIHKDEKMLIFTARDLKDGKIRYYLMAQGTTPETVDKSNQIVEGIFQKFKTDPKKWTMFKFTYYTGNHQCFGAATKLSCKIFEGE